MNAILIDVIYVEETLAQGSEWLSPRKKLDI